MGQKFPVTYIEHEDGLRVYCWDWKEGIETINSCLLNHPDEPISEVGVEMMTEKQYDKMAEYDGDC